MSSRVQETIVRYLIQRDHDPRTTHIRSNSDGCVVVDTPNGTKKLSINIYEDILEIGADGSKKIIAVSDLPHESMELGYKRATSWTQKEGATV